jgi:hypothetical protein
MVADKNMIAFSGFNIPNPEIVTSRSNLVTIWRIYDATNFILMA